MTGRTTFSAKSEFSTLCLDSQIESLPSRKSSFQGTKDNSGFLSKFLDKVQYIFIDIEKHPIRLEDDQSFALLTVEESEYRIILLLITTAFLMIHFSAVLILVRIIGILEIQSPIIVMPKISSLTISNTSLIQHMAFMDTSGYIYDLDIDYESRNASLNWQLKVPKSPDFFMFTNDKKIYVAYGDVKKKMTYLKSDQFHRTLGHSQVPMINHQVTEFGGKHVQVGNFIWFLLGQRHQLAPGSFCIGSNSLGRTLIWSLKKQTWLLGPSWPSNIFTENSCGVPDTNIYVFAKNRTSALVFQLFKASFLFDFSTGIWTILKHEAHSDLNSTPHVCFQLQDKNYSSAFYVITYNYVDEQATMYASINDGIDWNWHSYLNFLHPYHFTPAYGVMNGVVYLLYQHSESDELIINYLNLNLNGLVHVDTNVTLQSGSQPLNALTYFQASCPTSEKESC